MNQPQILVSFGPTIGAAALLKLPGLFHSDNVGALENALLGAACAAIAACGVHQDSDKVFSDHEALRLVGKVDQAKG